MSNNKTFKTPPAEYLSSDVAPGFCIENILHGTIETIGEPNATKVTFDWLNSVDDENINRVKITAVVSDAAYSSTITGFPTEQAARRFCELVTAIPDHNPIPMSDFRIHQWVPSGDEFPEFAGSKQTMFTVQASNISTIGNVLYSGDLPPDFYYDDHAAAAFTKALHYGKDPHDLWERLQELYTAYEQEHRAEYPHLHEN